ncbi:MAG: LysM peptidoglycan-binding domain-containing protein [Anaerolineae bacterium]|nr:LysM peptidoglycan-binding domain-containing protein [Anaerolineae bacterium]
MRRRHVIYLLIAAVLVCLFMPTPERAPVLAYQGGSNLLLNPGFEEPYAAIGGDSSLTVASNWQPWSWPQGASSSINAQPEYKKAPSERIRSGSAAQEYNTFFATHTGGVYQRVPVAPGTELRFSIHVYVWSSATFADPNVSEDPNDVLVRVGIDPTGGTDGTSAAIIWSLPTEFYDEYRELSVTATAQGTAVTVFVESAPQGFVGVNNIYLDDAVLNALGIAPTPVPTNTPGIEPTQEGEVTPGPTLTPVSPPTQVHTPMPTLPGYTSTVTYVVQAGDTLSGLSQRFGSTVEAIVQYNGLTNAALIVVGQTLVIPIQAGVFPLPPTFTPAPTLPGSGMGGPVNVPTAYTVVYGDTLYSIAAAYNSTVNTLAILNNIVNPSLIFPGQVLTVSGVVSPPVVQPTAVPVVVPAQPVMHVVQYGENLFRVGLLYNVRWDVLAAANGIYNPHLLFPGQVVIIPR